MTLSHYMQFALELWGAFIVLACAITSTLELKVDQRRNLILAHLLYMDTTLLISDSIAILYRGNETITGFYAVRISNFLVFALIPLMILQMVSYIHTLVLENKGKTHKIWPILFVSFCGLHLLLLISSLFINWVYYFDSHNFYHRLPGYNIITGIAFIELLLLVIMLMVNRRYIPSMDRKILILYIFLPTASSVFQAFHYGLSLNNISITISLLLLFLSNELDRSKKLLSQKELLLEREMTLKNQELLLSQRNQELAETRLQLSLSQMQPHFIFNTLGSIEQLCKMDAKKAAEATHYFSRYLRKNLHALNINDQSSFSEELNHVRSYIWLEKMRFGDDFVFTESIDTSEFYLPTLSIQPLIETSVKHGLMGFSDHVLHVTLTAVEEEDGYLITITNDGDGFIPEISTREEFERQILFNIRERLRILCDGTIELITRPTGGMEFTIRIPLGQEDTQAGKLQG